MVREYSVKTKCIIKTLALSFCLFLGLGANSLHAAYMPSGYSSAKVELARLQQDTYRATYRHHWIRLSDDFYEIYRNNANWANRPGALFRSAKSLDEMARRSYVRKDAQSAISRYEILLQKHGKNPLADDALYAIARLYDELLQDKISAKVRLGELVNKYPRGDFAEKALQYSAVLGANSVASLGNVPTARPSNASITLTRISPQVRNNVVRIVLSMDAIASWTAKYDSQASVPGVVITLRDVAPTKKINLQDSFGKSGIFTGYQVNYSAAKAQSVITLEFSDLLRYTVKLERMPARLIVEATSSSKELLGGITVRKGKKVITRTVPTRLPKKAVAVSDVKKSNKDWKNKHNFAAQLGLTVGTIIIDPGHGGKDPGSMNKGLVESGINLDVSKRLAKVLRKAGYRVLLTRETDVFLSFAQRSDFAMRNNGDLFISIHANAHANGAVKGFETYYLNFSDNADVIRLAAVENLGVSKRLGELEQLLGDILLNARIEESKKLAKIVQRNAVQGAADRGFGVRNGGARGAPFHVLIGTSMPGILIELGYSTNSYDARNLGSPAFRNAITESIANGIHQYALELLQAAK